jgi:hypothetical protein
MADKVSDFQKLLGRALIDDHFRATLHKDPASALKECGIEVTPQKIAALTAASASLANAQEAFGGQVRYC